MNDRNDRGLSDALGAVVLISVVALGVTLFGVAILSGPLPDRIPALNAEVTNTSDTVFIRHTGGDTLVNGEYRILADGSDRTSDFLSGGAVPAQWSVGDTLEYHLQPNEEIPSSIHIIAITGKSEYVILQVQVQPPTLVPTYPSPPRRQRPRQPRQPRQPQRRRQQPLPPPLQRQQQLLPRQQQHQPQHPPAPLKQLP